MVPDPENYSIILRFLGTSPLSSNMFSVYNLMIYQIAKMYNLKRPDRILNNFGDLKETLLNQFVTIESLYPNQKLIIILDSLDQLNAADYKLEWFIENIPSNVRMIYSTLPEHGEIRRNLLTQFPRLAENVATNFLEIKRLDKQLSIRILEDWMKKVKRNLSIEQWATINKMFADESVVLYPLYIKLIFDIVVRWTSFQLPDTKFISCKCIDDCIKYLFEYLEVIHGKLLFSRAIIYMSSFKNGISENEIEDILSIGNFMKIIDQK